MVGLGVGTCGCCKTGKFNSLFIRQKTGNFAHFGRVLRIMETHLYKMLRRRSLDKNTPNSLKWITGKNQRKIENKLCFD